MQYSAQYLHSNYIHVYVCLFGIRWYFGTRSSAIAERPARIGVARGCSGYPQFPTHLRFIIECWYYFVSIYSFTYSSPALAAALFRSAPVEKFVLLSTKLALQNRHFSAQNALKLIYRHLRFQRFSRGWHPQNPLRRERGGGRIDPFVPPQD